MSSGYYPCLICAEEFNSVVSLNQHEVDSNHVTRPFLKTDKKKARQAYLDALYKNKVMVPKGDRDESVQYVTSVLKRIMDHVRAQQGGDLYGNEIKKAGSHSSRTKVQLADEFDFIVPLITEGSGWGNRRSHVPYIFEDKLFQRQESEASVTNLNVPRKLVRHPYGGQEIPNGYTPIECTRFPTVSFDGDVIARKVQEDLYAKIKLAVLMNPISPLKDPRIMLSKDLDLSRESHGPAITLTMNTPGRHNISIDITPTINAPIMQVTMYGWPRQETRMTLSEDHIQRIIAAGIHLTPKGGEFWNISFSKAEKALMQNIDSGNQCRRMCHKILKSDVRTWQSRSRNGLKGISTYLLKHQLFWMNEEKRQIPDYWWQGNLATCYMDMLSDLRGRLIRRVINDYFNPSINILDGKDPAVLSEFAAFVEQRLMELNTIFD